MAEGKRRDVAKERMWRRLVAKQRGCRGSIRAFCRREGVEESLFYAWRRELQDREVDHDGGEGMIVPIDVERREDVVEGQWAIEIELWEDVRVRIKSGSRRRSPQTGC